MYALGDITGALVLNWVGLPAIGGYSEDRINAEKTAKGSLSVPGLAISYFEEAAAACGVGLGSLTQAKTDQVNAALLWYIAGEYMRLHRAEYPGECSEEQESFQANCYAEACRQVKRVSDCMSRELDFCAYATEDDLPAIFGATIYTEC